MGEMRLELLCFPLCFAGVVMGIAIALALVVRKVWPK